MAKHARKIAEALNRRREAAPSSGRHPVNGMATKVPGSQNRKHTGYGKGSKR